MTPQLQVRYLSFRRLYASLGHLTPAHEAMAMARTMERAEAEGLSVTWEDDDLPWDGDGCPRPAIVALATVMHPDHEGEAPPRFPFCDGTRPRKGYVQSGDHMRRREVLAQCGGIGLETWSDPYVRDVECELLGEALDNLDEERDAATTAEASVLASRATFAGVAK